MGIEIQGNGEYVYLLQKIGTHPLWNPLPSPARFTSNIEVVVVSEPGHSAKQGLIITPGKVGEKAVVDEVLLELGVHHEYRDKGFPLVTVF